MSFEKQPTPEQRRYIMRLKSVEQETGLKRSTIYERMAEGTFPRSVSLGGRSRGWYSDEIQHWVDNRPR